MSRRNFTPPAAMLALWLVLGAWHATPALAKGSFLKQPIASASAFIGQVGGDVVLQKRYGKHLGVAPEAVVGILRERLRPDTLSKAGFFTVYNVTKDGLIYPTKQRLQEGTRIYRLADSQVFFTRMGDPAVPFALPTVQPKSDPKQPVPAREPVEQVIIIHVPSE